MQAVPVQGRGLHHKCWQGRGATICEGYRLPVFPCRSENRARAFTDDQSVASVIPFRKSQAFKGAAVLWLGGLDGGLKEKKLGRSDWVRFQRMSYRISFYNS